MVRAGTPNVAIQGVRIHIGSQLASAQATLQAIEAALKFIGDAQTSGTQITMLDIGGGFPVAYTNEQDVPNVEAFAAPIVARLDSWPGDIHIEPGRSVVADAAALLTQVQYEKSDPVSLREAAAGKPRRRTVIVDAGMQTLMRPALYEAYHRVWPVRARATDSLLGEADVAGPICESADFLAHQRQLPPMGAGDLLAVLDTGAYGFSMASNYNSQPLPAEVLVEGETHRLIRRRQTYSDLIATEIV